MHDPYVYPESEILINRFGIKDEKVLNEMEAEYTSLRIREMEICPVKGSFHFKHVCEIHRYMFQDMFEWAGCPRTINIEKMEPALGGLSIEYAKYDTIESETTVVLDQMKARKWSQMSLHKKAENFSADLAALWKIHAFREGNTRTSVIFMFQFMESKGIAVERSIFESHSDYVRTSLVAASAKFYDLGDLSKPEYLIRIVEESLEKGKNMHMEQLRKSGLERDT